MTIITEEMIMDLVIECNGVINYNDLYDRFKNVKMTDMQIPVKTLVNKRILDWHEGDRTWNLTEYGKQYIQEDADKRKRDLEKQNLDFEKSKVDYELAKKMLKEYPTTKKMARYGFIIAVVLAAIELIRFLHELTSK